MEPSDNLVGRIASLNLVIAYSSEKYWRLDSCAFVDSMQFVSRTLRSTPDLLASTSFEHDHSCTAQAGAHHLNSCEFSTNLQTCLLDESCLHLSSPIMHSFHFIKINLPRYNVIGNKHVKLLVPSKCRCQ